MSAPLGGASFDLGVRRDRYRQELNEAINEARAASQQIQAALSGGQSLPQIQSGQQDRALLQLASSGEAAASEIKQLATASEDAIRPAQQMAAAYTAAAAAARDLAAAQQGVRNNTGTLSDSAALRREQGAAAQAVKPGQIPFRSQSTDTATLSGQEAQAYGALIVSAQQVQAAMNGASAAVKSVGTAAAGSVNEIKALVSSQSALNSLVSAFARAEVVTTGAEDIAGAVEKAQDALANVNAGHYEKAFTDLGDASVEARAALLGVNAAIAELTTGNVDLGNLQKLINEFDDLRAAGVSPDHPILQDLKAQIEAAGGSTDSTNEEEQSLVRLNAQAKTLTQAIAQLSAAQKALAADSGTSADATAKLTAEVKRQEAELAKAVEQTRLTERARETAIFAQTDPRTLARQDAGTALQGTGLSAGESKAAVDRLQASILAIDKLKISSKVAEGLGDIDRAAELADKALDEFAKGDRVAGVRLQEQAIKELREAMAQLSIAAAKVRGDMIGVLTPDKNAELAPILAQASKVQAAIRTSEAALRSSRAPELKAEQEAQEKIAKAQKEGADATERQARGQRQIRSQLYSSAQDLGYAVGQGQVGQLTAGVGRFAEVLVQKGIVSTTAAAAGLTAGLLALGAALGITLVKGFEFNAFLEESKVRLEATEGSAAKAQVALDKLVAQAGSRTFGSFDFKDLETAEALLKRLGQERDGDLTRIADLAAVAGKSMTDTATQVAHLYDTIKAGQPLGDMVRSLERSGLLTAQWGNRLLAAAASGATVEEQIKLLDEAFSRFDGTAAKMGTTTTSSVNRVKVAFGALSGSLTEGAFDKVGLAASHLADIISSDRVKEGVRLYKDLGEHLADIYLTMQTVGLNKAVAPFIGEVRGASQNLTEPGENVSIPTRFNDARSQIEAGRAAVTNYAKGFDAASREAFDDLSRTVEDNLKAISGGKLATVTEVAIAGQINPLLAELTKEIQDTGAVSERTAERVRAALGQEADRVLELARTYAQLRQAKEEVDRAGNALNTARGNLQITDTFRQSVLGQDQGIIDRAEKTAQDHRDKSKGQIDDLNDVINNAEKVANAVDKVWAAREKTIAGEIKALDEANRRNAESARVAIQAQQDSLDAYREGITARRRGAAKDIEGLQDVVSEIDKRLTAASAAQTQHQDAFNAAINGTIDLFDQVNTQQDDITRKILAKWDAEISGQRRARLEAEQAVDKRELGSLELQLKYNERIQALRQNGRTAEAAALERERDRVLAQRQQEGQVDRDKAELARRREQAAIADARKAAAQQGATDQAGVNTIQGEKTAAQQAVEDAQKREKVLQEIEDHEVERRQAEIDHLQRVEADRARAAAAEIEAKQKELDGIQDAREADAQYFRDYTDFQKGKIEDIQKTAREQEIADNAAIAAAKKQYDDDKIYWDARYNADQQAVKDAQAVYDNAKILEGVYSNQITSLGTINKALDDRITREERILDLLRQQYGLTSNPAPLSGATGGAKDNQPGVGQPASEAAVGAKKPPLIEAKPGFPPPDGYHTERDDASIMWWVPNGYTLENYGKRSADSGAGAAAAAGARQAFGGRSALRETYAFAQGGIIAEHVVGIGMTTGARYEFGERGIRERIAPVVPGVSDTSRGGHVGPLFTIGTVNASDPVDVDRMIGLITSRVFDIGLGALDVTRRGGIVRGRDRTR